MAVDNEWGLDGKVAIVTGGGSSNVGIGNGRAAAILLARAGAHVLVVDRVLDEAEKTVAMIAEEGGSAAAGAYDVMVEAQCSAMVDDAVRRWGKLDCLDNNVGGGSFGTVVDVSATEWARAMDLNLNHVFLVSKYAVPAMIRSGGGSIVNISSMAAVRPHGLTPYSTAKGAVHALTQAMAVDHGPDGVRVNCVVVGPMHTPVMYNYGMNEEMREERRKASLMGKEGTGWDIGAAVRFFLSEQAKFITGQILCVDGGMGLQSPKRDTKLDPSGIDKS